MFRILLSLFQSTCFNIPTDGHPFLLATFKSNVSEDEYDHEIGCDVDLIEVVSNYLTSYLVIK